MIASDEREMNSKFYNTCITRYTHGEDKSYQVNQFIHQE